KKQEAELATGRLKLIEETVRNYRKAGEARYSDYAFAEALSAYRKALSFVERDKQPELWAAIQVDVGLTCNELAGRAEGPALNENLAPAIAAFRDALKIYARQQFPQQWATTQNDLGNALAQQGTRTDGEEGGQLLGQAVRAYRGALEVFTR